MALLSAVGITAGSIIVGYIKGRQQIENQLDSAAALKALAITGWANDLQNELLFAVNDQTADARISIVLDLARSHQYYTWYNEAVRLRLLTLIEQSREFEEVCLLDLNGAMVLCTASKQVSENCQNERFFQTGLVKPYVELPFMRSSQKPENQTSRIGEFGHQEQAVGCHFGLTPSDLPLVIASRPVIGSQGELFGVIAGRTNAAEVTRILTDRTGLGNTGRAYLTDTRFSPFPNEPEPFAYDVDETELWRPTAVDMVLQNQSPISGIYPGSRGAQVFGIYRWVPDVQAVLAVEQTFAEAFGEILLQLAVNAGIAVFAVLVAVGVSFLITRSITQPLVGLVETASKIAAGDLQRTAPVQRDDEIGVLATAFNSMTGQLRELISHLEERVLERTQALRAANEVLQRRALQLETNAQVSRQITSILEIDDLLARVVQLIQGAFGYFDSRIFLLEGEDLVLRTTARSGQRQVARLLISQTSLNTEAVRTNHAVVVNDVTQDSRYLIEEHSTDAHAELVIPLRVGERVIGTLDVVSEKMNAFASEDVLVIQSLGDQVAIAIENARLYERNRELAVVEGRNQLARDLHDSVNQSLYSLNLLFEAWRGLVQSDEGANVEDYFNRAAEISQQALGEMRILLHELRPAAFEDGGLVGALQRRLDAVEGRAGVEAHLVSENLIDLPAPVQDCLYRIAQEALNNALKHAAASRVIVRLSSQDNNQVTLQVADNGHGFNPGCLDSQGGMGLTNMRQRAAEMGGSLIIESTLGKGTTITTSISCAPTVTVESNSL